MQELAGAHHFHISMNHCISVFESCITCVYRAILISSKRQLVWLTLLSFNFVAFIKFLATNEAKPTAVRARKNTPQASNLLNYGRPTLHNIKVMLT